MVSESSYLAPSPLCFLDTWGVTLTHHVLTSCLSVHGKFYRLVWRKASLKKLHDWVPPFLQPWAISVSFIDGETPLLAPKLWYLFLASRQPFQEMPRIYPAVCSSPTKWHLTGIWCLSLAVIGLIHSKSYLRPPAILARIKPRNLIYLWNVIAERDSWRSPYHLKLSSTYRTIGEHRCGCHLTHFWIWHIKDQNRVLLPLLRMAGTGHLLYTQNFA